MKTLTVGRVFTIVVLLGALVWQGIQAYGGRPSELKGEFPKPAMDEAVSPNSKEEIAVFAGGCFWGTQAVFQHVRGVKHVTSGYSGGTVPNPRYELVSAGDTGHAESIRITYDPRKVTYGTLLMVFFSVAHDPTQKNRQGPDIGTQYRSIVFHTNEEQRKIAAAYIAQIDAAKVYSRPIVTELIAYSAFYKAEDYHQDYLNQHPDNPYIQYNDLPKLRRLKALYPSLYN